MGPPPYLALNNDRDAMGRSPGGTGGDNLIDGQDERIALGLAIRRRRHPPAHTQRGTGSQRGQLFEPPGAIGEAIAKTELHELNRKPVGIVRQPARNHHGRLPWKQMATSDGLANLRERDPVAPLQPKIEGAAVPAGLGMRHPGQALDGHAHGVGAVRSFHPPDDLLHLAQLGPGGP